MTAPLFEVLIPTIPHRHDRLCALLAGLDRQYQPGFGVRVCRDNLEHSIGTKRQALLESSAATWTAFVDDDDEVSPEYVTCVMTALEVDPDYVGFTVKISGEANLMAEHSLRHRKWDDGPPMRRDLSHLNPIRRELALLAPFDTQYGTFGEDGHWAYRLRATGKVKTEAFIGGGWMYHYRANTSDCATSPRGVMPEDQIGPLPSYPWLVAL